jgi:hypothetical protein
LRETAERRRQLETVLAAAVSLVAIAVVYWRLYYGIDFTDESWYVAVPYRLVLGARPYVDEISVPQTTAAILMYPFFWVYDRLAGLTGIVLFVRHLQFVLSLAAAAGVFVSVRPLVGRNRALLIGSAIVLFVPFDIHSLSYDSIGSDMFAAGCLLAFAAAGSSRAARRAAPLCLGLAAFAYPPLLPAVALVCGTHVVAERGRGRVAAAWRGGVALALPLAGFALLAGTAGLHVVAADYRNSSTYLGQAGGFGKLVSIAGHEWHTLPLRYLLFGVLATIAVLWERKPGLARLLVATLPVLVLPPRLTFYAASLEYVAHLAWLAPALLLLVHRRPPARRLFATVWVPAVVGGFLTAYSSSNGGANLAIGFLPGAVVTAVFLVWAIEPSAPSLLATVPLVVVVAALALFVAVPVYRDGSLSTLTARVGRGPFAGLLTSPRKRAFVAEIGKDVGRWPRQCRIVFLNDFPAGYLLTKARPDTNAAWIERVPRSVVTRYRDGLIRYYRRHGFPDVVVLTRRVPYAPPTSARVESYDPGDPLLLAVHAHRLRLVAKRFDYRIYARARACA